MNQKERMLAGLPYKAWMDGLPEESMENALKTYRYNSLPPNDTAGAEKLIREILGKAGKNITIRPPFYCDYGKNIEKGMGYRTRTGKNAWGIGQLPVILAYLGHKPRIAAENSLPQRERTALLSQKRCAGI